MTPAITHQQITDALTVWNVRALVKFTAKPEHAQELLEGKPHLRAIDDSEATSSATAALTPTRAWRPPSWEPTPSEQSTA